MASHLKFQIPALVGRWISKVKRERCGIKRYNPRIVMGVKTPESNSTTAHSPGNQDNRKGKDHAILPSRF